ncbi:MAG: FHA domain-containing protein, partial [Vicinamibacterales bacterium]|nr:FHA domain-containing protein [Vicinamibacterales bacterium]
CTEALAALDERRARFLEAFGGEDSLEAFMAQAPKPVTPAPEPAPAQPPPPGRPADAPPAEPVPAAPPAITRSVPIPDVVPDPPTRGVLPPPDEPVPEADRTRMVTLDAAGNLVAPELDAVPAGVSDTGEARTMILPSAVLTIRLKGEPPRECAVSPVTSIGRSDHNTVCIPRRNVSREHAAIQATPAGFLLKDLGSQNGTLVNGDTIKECLLHDGDVVIVGDAQIEFRLLAPPGR